MTIENTEVIDNAGKDRRSGEVILTISDHLSWDDPNRHFRLLEQKISRYLDFIQSGQILERFPEASATRVRISLICQHDPTEAASRFLAAAQQQLEQTGIGFSFDTLPPA
jgi:hypothetical protein